MPTKIASAAEIAAKWAEVTPGRQKYYEENTPEAATDWEAHALAAAPTFRAAVPASGIEKRFAGGVKQAGAAKFARKVSDVGVDRFGPGVRAAVPDMQSGVDPYVTVIAAVTPPARGPRGDPGNLERVRVFADALAKKRLALLGAAS